MLTITEALAEIKTINARVQKRHEAISRYVVRPWQRRDPLENEGGSVEFVRSERQAIKDLEKRLVAIRTAIQKANLETALTVGNETRTVAEWLNWRRDVSENYRRQLNDLVHAIGIARQEAFKTNGKLVEDSGNLNDVFVAIKERELSEEVEHFENVLGELDGKLSLTNATTTIDV